MKRVLVSAVSGVALCVVGAGGTYGEGNDSYSKTLLHFNGTDAATTFTDESGRSWTAEGNAQLDTAEKRFGSASLLLDGDGDYVHSAHSSDWDFGTGNFTIDFWMKRNGVSGYAGMVSTLNSSYAGMVIDGSSAGNRLRLISSYSGGTTADIISTTTVSDLTWTHVALVRNGNAMTLYQDGNSVGSANSTGWTCNSAGLGLSIGQNMMDLPNNYLFIGWIDEVRVSKGIARWTANFNPPTSEYTNDPPTAFSLTTPSNTTSTNNNKPAFCWGTSADPETQPITYTLKLSTTAGFTEPVYRTVSGLSATTYTPDGGQEILDGSYYWKVIASDGVMQRESTETWRVTVDTQVPVVPVITFIGSHSQTGKIIEIRGTGENGTTLTFYDKNNNTISGTPVWAGDTFTFTPTTPLDPGSSLYVRSQDGASNTSQSRTHRVVFEDYMDIFKADDVYHGSVPGNSMRLEKDTSYEFTIAVNAGSPVTVKAWLMYNSYYDGSGADAPGITLSGPGITTGNTAAMTSPASYTPDTWEQLTVTGTPAAKGVVMLTVETFSTVAGSATWVDDLSVAQ